MTTNYKIVDFIGTNCIEVVPDFWIEGTRVRWGKPAAIYARKGKAPKTDWKYYSINIRYKNQSYSSYEEAVNKCNSLLSATDSSCAEEREKDKKNNKRRRNIKQHDSEFTNSSASSESDRGTHSPISPPPNFNRTPSPLLLNERPLDTNAEEINEEENPTTVYYINEGSTQIKNYDVQFQHITTSLQDIQTKLDSLLEMKNMFENFVLKSKREWEEMKILHMSNGGEQKTSSPKNKENMAIVNSMLPLQSRDDLQLFEDEILSNESYIEIFHHIIKKVGGKNGKRHLGNVIDFCFDFTFQKQINWSGVKGKVHLKDRLITSKILQNVVASHREFTTHEATQHIKYLFQHTFDRAKKHLVK